MNQAPCTNGQFDVFYPPFNVPDSSRVGGSYGVILNVIEVQFPPGHVVTAVGQVSGCPLSSTTGPSSVAITGVTLFTPSNNNTQIPIDAGIRPDFDPAVVRTTLLAHGVIYATVLFNTSAFSSEQLAALSDSGKPLPLDDFFCVLANDVLAANAAASLSKRSPRASPTPAVDPNAVPAFLVDAKRNMSAGEIAGISIGIVIATVSIAAFVIVSRNQRSGHLHARQQPPRPAGL
jgi:hypothetical protein